MAEPQAILRGLALLAEPHRLLRPSRAVEGSIGRSDSSAARARPALVVAQPSAESMEEMREAARRAGYEQAMLEDRQSAQAAGYEAGFQEGRQHGQQAASAQLDKAIAEATGRAQEILAQRMQRFDRLLATLPAEMERHFADSEEDMLALAFEALCGVLGEHAASRDMLRAQLLRALQSWTSRTPLTMHVHPDDVRLMQEDAALADTMLALGYSSVRWQADSAVTLGGFILHSSEGGLDARLETQLAALKLALQQARAVRVVEAALPISALGASSAA